MQFEYDQKKSDSNFEKHGIDFETAQALWDESTVEFKANVRGENRFKVIGRIYGEYWAAIITKRKSRIRLISVRKATTRERSAYDRHINNQR